MRSALVLGVLVAFASPAAAQKKDEAVAPRFGIEADIDGFPQATAKDALRSALKAADARRYDYLVAHIVDPDWVDKQAKESFEKLVGVVRARWTDDPQNVKELRRFLSDGVWEETSDTATAKLKEIKTRQVFLKKIGNRWFLKNDTKAK